MINNTIELIPAYGRRYKTQKAMKADFKNNKDFASELGYTSIRDLESMVKQEIETVYCQVNNTIIYIVRFGKIQKWVK